MMAFNGENKFWLARPVNGRTSLYTTGQQLRQDCYEYFDWAHENPLFRHEMRTEDKVLEEVSIPQKRAFTMQGLMVFLGVSLKAWESYRYYDDMKEVVQEVEMIIRTQKFEGAAAGLLHAHIISRDLGLQDRQLIGSDPENPMPSQITIFELPNNSRDLPSPASSGEKVALVNSLPPSDD